MNEEQKRKEKECCPLSSLSLSHSLSHIFGGFCVNLVCRNNRVDMKKLFIAFLALLVLFLLYAYLVIPNAVSIRRGERFSGNARLVYRMVMSDHALFWTEAADGRTPINKGFRFHGHDYRISDRKLNSLVVTIDGRPSQLDFISSQADSVELNWELRIPMPVNPVGRIRGNAGSDSLRSDMTTLLAQMRAYDTNPDRAYGRRITEAQVQDSILLFTYGETKNYPTLPYIYSLIDELKAYTASQSAQVTGTPMLHVTTTGGNYLTKVAVPVNKRLKSFGKISYKWMLGGGNILITDVKGGPGAIREAFAQLEEYVNDHDRVAPAIPFESLITNRLEEKDTAKWITRIYYPVM